jgi:hypothetical protein
MYDIGRRKKKEKRKRKEIKLMKIVHHKSPIMLPDCSVWKRKIDGRGNFLVGQIIGFSTLCMHISMKTNPFFSRHNKLQEKMLNVLANRKNELHADETHLKRENASRIAEA